jgi:Phage integrase family
MLRVLDRILCGHTAATEMLRQGLHPKVVADRLGHASTRMTLDVYSHVMLALESDAAVKVDFAFRQTFGQQSGQQNERVAPTSAENDRKCLWRQAFSWWRSLGSAS